MSVYQQKNYVMYKHFIFTRFNEGWLDNDRLTQSGKPVNTDVWLKERCKLFEKFCLPSMMYQSNQNFTWLILFDKRTPEDILLKYDKIENITIIHEKHPEWIQKKMSQRI